jgi:hypothetical protein
VFKPPSRFCFIVLPESGLGEFWGSGDWCWKYPRLIVAKDFGAVCSQNPETYQYTDVLSLVVLRIVPTGCFEFLGEFFMIWELGQEMSM